MSPEVSVTDLVKEYGSLRAVDGVSFEVRRGEVLALLGPNGAGKTTTVEILEGYRKRTSGSVRVLGTDPATGGREFRDRIGIVLQSSGIDPELTVSEAIDFYGACYSRRRSTDEMIELVGLGCKADARVASLSGGQRRRIDMALGLVGDPDVVLLDEPTTGFDPAARRRGWDVVRRLASQRCAVLLTTHYLDEAENLADRVVVLAKGRIVAEGTPADLRALVGLPLIRFAVPDGIDLSSLSGVLESLMGTVATKGRYVEVAAAAPTADLARLTGWAVEQRIELEELSVALPSLEEVYLHLVEDAGVVEDEEGVEDVGVVGDVHLVEDVEDAGDAGVGGEGAGGEGADGDNGDAGVGGEGHGGDAISGRSSGGGP